MPNSLQIPQSNSNSNTKTKPSYYPFLLTNRWALKNNLLSGITTPALLNVLWRHRSAIDWRLYWQRVLFLLVISIPNTILAIIEHLLFHKKIQQQQLHPEPIFVLGHPRTGTTLIQNLLCTDPHFAYVDTFQAGFPSAFLLLQRFKWCLAWIIDKQRPMDNLPLSFSTPAEDEIAVNTLTGGISPYMCITFMTRYRDSLKYATFEGCSEAEIKQWSDALLYFLKKVSLCNPGKPLIIKSPVHIGRLPILRKLFPRAKFVFVHRHPMTVFASSAVLAQKYFTYCYLDKPTPAQITDYILEQHAMLYSVYIKERNYIPANQLSEVSFDELENDPLGTLRRVYTELNIDGFEDRMEEKLAHYCKQIEGFKKNDLKPLSPELQARLDIELAPVMKAFNYS